MCLTCLRLENSLLSALSSKSLQISKATELLRAGVPIEVVAKLLTHRSSVTTSQTYVHLTPEDLRAELARAGFGDRGGR